MIYGTIGCLGDSLTFGARAHLGYPELLPDLLRSADPDGDTEWITLNRGISGQATRQVLDRAPGVVRELAGMPGARWLVVCTGTNDSKAGGSQTITVDQYASLYRQILHWPRRHAIPSVVCTLPPIAPNQMPYFTDRSAEWLARANVAIREMQAEMDCEPAPIRLCDLADMPPSYLADGVHLRPAGYAWMAARIAGALGYRAAEPDAPETKPKPRRRLAYTDADVERAIKPQRKRRETVARF